MHTGMKLTIQDFATSELGVTHVAYDIQIDQMSDAARAQSIASAVKKLVAAPSSATYKAKVSPLPRLT